MSATLQFWLWFYLICGIATWIFMSLNFDFLENTPWWRRVLSWLFCVVLWPIVLVILMFEG
jgi:hypothetical protein